jgi:type IV pilus biogenesis protein CpaD/CtpE
MRKILLALLVTLLAACTHHPVRVDCDQHLEAINPPHPVVKTDGAAKSP